MKNYIKILRFLKPYWFATLLGVIFLLFEVIMNLLIPKTMGTIVNMINEISEGVIFNEVIKNIFHYGLLMLFFSLLNITFNFLSNYFSNVASCDLGNVLRINTFKKALKMSFASLDEFETGKVITRATADTNNLRWITKSMLRNLFRAPFMLIGAFFMAISINPKLSIILFINIPIIFFVNYIVVVKSYPKIRKVQDKLEYVNTITFENLENIRVVKAFDRSNYENEKFNESINDLMTTTIKANKFNSINSPIFMIIISMSTIAVLFIGGYSHVDIGDTLAAITYLNQIAGALQLLTGLISMLPRAEASAIRILELLEADTELPKEVQARTDSNINGKIEFDHVSFAYNNSRPILNDINFSINPGEKLGIIGPTGSGKTTLVNLISRFYDPTKGQVKIDDVNIKNYDLKMIRSQISTVMQKALLFAGTIEDNIRLGAMEAEEPLLVNASKNAQAYEFITRFSEGYNSILGERGINLSGGQKQRLSMARSLITQPKILIFDDSTSAVDMTTEVKILEAINKNLSKQTVIIIAQRIRSVMNADKILVIENGSITGLGTHDELLKTNKYYQDIYETQMGGAKYA